MAVPPQSLDVLAISGCGREMEYRERAVYVKLCTLTGHSGQDESGRLPDSFLYQIGQNFVKLCPHVVLINFGTFPDNRYRAKSPRIPGSSVHGQIA